MTVQAAKESLTLCKITRVFIPKDEVLEFVIQALEELEQYRALGTVEELKDLKEMNKNCTIEQLTGVECSYNETGCSDCKGKQALLEAMEKQVAKKPTHEQYFYGSINHCSECNWLLRDRPNYCPKCGQALKWGEEDV